MARRPPQRRSKQRGQLPTTRLPNKPDANRTWNGHPVSRTPGRWSGSVDFRGKKHWVGTRATPFQWGLARDKLIARLTEERAAEEARETELDGKTIRDFVGPPGEEWPWVYTKKRNSEGTFRNHEQMIKALVAEFGDRRIKNGITRTEATKWVARATANQVSTAIAMFNDAREIDETVTNPFAGMSKNRGRGRAELPYTLTRDEVDLLRRVARRLHPDGYGRVLEAMIELGATAGPRTGEVFALEWARIDRASGEIRIEHAVKAGGKLGEPKYGQRRWIPLAPSALELIEAMPRLHERFLFPTQQGRKMTQPNWTYYWHRIRDTFAALLPDDHWLVLRIADRAEQRAAEPDPKLRRRIPHGKLDFYELRHSSATWLATPPPDGLGLAPADIAVLLGHRDQGKLAEEIYVHRNAELARARVREALKRAHEAAATGTGAQDHDAQQEEQR